MASMLSVERSSAVVATERAMTSSSPRNLGFSTSYVAKGTDVLAVEETGNCVFRGAKVSITTFVDNRARNNYVCSTCGYNADTEAEAVESAARGLGSRLVAGDRYLVGVPDRRPNRQQGKRSASGVPFGRGTHTLARVSVLSPERIFARFRSNSSVAGSVATVPGRGLQSP